MTTTMLCRAFPKAERQTQLTSIWANNDAEETNLKQWQYEKIRQALKIVGNMNNSEISYMTGIKISSVTARVNELRKRKEVYFVGRRKDRQTNKTVMVWGLA